MGIKNLKTALILLFSAVVLVFSVPPVIALSPSINDLIEEATQYDGQLVTIEAELIGERLERGDFSWLNVNDGTNGIGIWVTSAQADTLHFYGNYDTTGDTVSITGIFHRSCTEHGGDVDIHAENITVITPGFPVAHPISVPKLIWAVSLSGATVICVVFYLHSRPQKKKKRVVSATPED